MPYFDWVFSKIVIADNLGVFVDRCFSDPKLHSAADLLLGVYAFAYQIYCDFAGYSNIAIGLSLCLGFILPANFDRPYFAFGIREFWRRWHISLSSWLRDYLYIPLGGSRKGDTNRNLLLTMGICGLWHGASWNMLLWGIYHGAAMVAQRTLGALIPAHTIAKLSGSVWGRAFGTLLTFHIVCAGWMLFRAPSLLHAQTYVLSLFKSDWALSTAAPIALALIATAVAIDILHGLGLQARLQPGKVRRGPIEKLDQQKSDKVEYKYSCDTGDSNSLHVISKRRYCRDQNWK